jgi:hypothetical protein
VAQTTEDLKLKKSKKTLIYSSNTSLVMTFNVSEELRCVGLESIKSLDSWFESRLGPPPFHVALSCVRPFNGVIPRPRSPTKSL